MGRPLQEVIMETSPIFLCCVLILWSALQPHEVEQIQGKKKLAKNVNLQKGMTIAFKVKFVKIMMLMDVGLVNVYLVISYQKAMMMDFVGQVHVIHTQGLDLYSMTKVFQLESTYLC